MTNIETCRTCIFYKAPREGWATGQCRRKAPGWQDLGDGHAHTRWPSTEPSDWCGEFEKAEVRRTA